MLDVKSLSAHLASTDCRRHVEADLKEKPSGWGVFDQKIIFFVR